MTNGEMLMKVWPHIEVKFVKKFSGLSRVDVTFDHKYSRYGYDVASFSEEWWNREYEGEGE